MNDKEQNIRDFINYGSGSTLNYSNLQLLAIFSLLEAGFFAMIYFLSDLSKDIETSLFGMIFLIIYSIFLFSLSFKLKKYEKTVLIGYLNNCIIIFSFSLLTIFFLIFVLVHSDAGIWNYIICFSLYSVFSVLNIVNTKRKISEGVYGEYLKPDYKINNKFITAVIIIFSVLALVIRIFAEYVAQSTVMILLEILLMILLCIYSLGNANFLKVYYILKYKFT